MGLDSFSAFQYILPYNDTYWLQKVLKHIRYIAQTKALSHPQSFTHSLLRVCAHTRTHARANTHTRMNRVNLSCGNLSEKQTEMKKYCRKIRIKVRWTLFAECNTTQGMYWNKKMHTKIHTKLATNWMIQNNWALVQKGTHLGNGIIIVYSSRCWSKRTIRATSDLQESTYIFIHINTYRQVLSALLLSQNAYTLYSAVLNSFRTILRFSFIPHACPSISVDFLARVFSSSDGPWFPSPWGFPC